MKIVEATNVEIRIEKQPKNSSCEWCTFFSIEKNKKSKLLFMTKSNNVPFLQFQDNQGNIIINSLKIKKKVLKTKRSHWKNYLKKLKKCLKN